MIDPNDPGTLDLVAACEGPLSGAERARRHRRKKKQEGVKAINLTRTDRMVLSLGLLAHEDLDHRPKDWATSKKPGFDVLLKKLWPEGDDGRYLAEPKRSTYRPTAFLRDQLEQARVENQRLKAAVKVEPFSDWQTRAEKAEAELAFLRAELQQIGMALPVTNQN